MLAALDGNAELIPVLMQAGADIDAQNSLGYTALMHAAFRCQSGAAEALLKHGASPEIEDIDGLTALAHAVKKDCRNIERLLRAANSDDGQTPLIAASRACDMSNVRALVSRKVNLEARDRLGRTALAWSAFEGCSESVKLLLAAGANPAVTDKDRATPLMLAARKGETNAVSALLRHGVNKNAQDIYGRTALVWAVDGRHVEAARELLRAGADPKIRTNNGQTAASLAEARGSAELKELFARRNL